jgi:hypothetical protein
MECKKSRIADGTMPMCIPALCRFRPKRARRSKPAACGQRLVWPPDPITRLLMEADGVTEIELDGLLRRIAAARGDR